MGLGGVFDWVSVYHVLWYRITKEEDPVYLDADSSDKRQGTNEEGKKQLWRLSDTEMYNFP